MTLKSSSAANPGPISCSNCNEQLVAKADHCPHCGTRQSGTATAASTALTDNFSSVAWAVAILRGLVFIPVGIAPAIYLYLKSRQGAGVRMSSLETWTVVILGVIGIAAVHLGGRTAAKWMWAIGGLLLGSGIIMLFGLTL